MALVQFFFFFLFSKLFFFFRNRLTHQLDVLKAAQPNTLPPSSQEDMRDLQNLRAKKQRQEEDLKVLLENLNILSRDPSCRYPGCNGPATCSLHAAQIELKKGHLAKDIQLLKEDMRKTEQAINTTKVQFIRKFIFAPTD